MGSTFGCPDKQPEADTKPTPESDKERNYRKERRRKADESADTDGEKTVRENVKPLHAVKQPRDDKMKHLENDIQLLQLRLKKSESALKSTQDRLEQSKAIRLEMQKKVQDSQKSNKHLQSLLQEVKHEKMVNSIHRRPSSTTRFATREARQAPPAHPPVPRTTLRTKLPERIKPSGTKAGFDPIPPQTARPARVEKKTISPVAPRRSSSFEVSAVEESDPVLEAHANAGLRSKVSKSPVATIGPVAPRRSSSFEVSVVEESDPVLEAHANAELRSKVSKSPVAADINASDAWSKYSSHSIQMINQGRANTKFNTTILTTLREHHPENSQRLLIKGAN